MVINPFPWVSIREAVVSVYAIAVAAREFSSPPATFFSPGLQFVVLVCTARFRMALQDYINRRRQ